MESFDWTKVVGQPGPESPGPPPEAAEEQDGAPFERVDVDPRNGEPVQLRARQDGADEGMRSIDDMHVDDLLTECVERKASDLHLSVGLPPTVRVDGELVQLPYKALGAQQTQRLVYDILSDQNLQKFEQVKELDFSHGVKGVGRFRVNVYIQRDSVGAAFRAIPSRIPAFEELRLPPIVREMSNRSSGLILVTGPTGSGKSTTIAAMVDDINRHRKCHIMTIEDPIEYLHHHQAAMVNQREVHHDTMSFHNALRAVLREDPDVILVGEMRDLETITAALTLAETGHLVFGTLHTRNAPQTVDRVIDVFPPEQQEQVRVLLGNTLEAVIAQQLLPRLGGGRVAAIEVMVATPAIRNLIREGKTHQMYSFLETSNQQGMQTMDRALLELHRNGYVTLEEVLMRAIDREGFQAMLKAA